MARSTCYLRRTAKGTSIAPCCAASSSLFVAVLAVNLTGRAQPASRHVVVVTIDGLRWQEFFGGADRDYFKRDKSGSAGEPERRFWRADAAARRPTLMPFMWKTIAARGQIFGDPASGSESRLTNGLWFSYPGYNEMFAGRADPRINSNDKVPNPNITVLEWLNRRPGFEGQVAAFGSWDVLPSILNVERSGLTVGSGWKPVPAPATERDRAINELATDLPRLWGYGPPTPRSSTPPWNAAHPPATRALRDARRGGRMGARGPLRSLPRRRAASGSVHRTHLGVWCSRCPSTGTGPRLW